MEKQENKIKKGKFYVITCYENVMDYLFNALERAPKKFRYSFVLRMEDNMLDTMSLLVSANKTQLTNPDRRKYQEDAKVKMDVLGVLLRIAYKQNCICYKTYENATKLIFEAREYLDKWIASDEKRLNSLTHHNNGEV